MIIIMAGGRAERMGRGVKSIDMTKGLMEIPKPSGGKETLIDRTLRLLTKVGAISNLKGVLLCVGYKADLVMKKYPRCQFLRTYNPDDPTDVLPAFLKVLEAFPAEDQYIFFLGDVVWSMQAIEDFLLHRSRAPMVLYHGTNPYYCEIFGMAINGENGRDLIRKTNACESMPVVPGEMRWELQGITEIPPKHCRISCMEMWIDMNHLPGKERVYQSGIVDDIDWDADHQRICKEIENGEYGVL